MRAQRTVGEGPTDEGPLVFVPIALKLDEAEALFNAARATFNSLAIRGLAALDGGELARATVTLAAAIDKARGTTDDEETA